jgi:hypothetical protein
MWQVPRRWDEDVVVGEDLRLLAIKVCGPHVAVAVKGMRCKQVTGVETKNTSRAT